MTDLEALLGGIVKEPNEETRWLVLADWLEENDEVRRAELLRLHRKLLATCCEPEAHPKRKAWQTRIVELIAEGVQPCVPQETIQLPGGVPMTLSFIPPGSFLMGSLPREEGRSNDETQHKVTLTQGFFLGIHTVTQAQWKAVMGNNPSSSKGDDLPVENVSWDDCQEFLKKLNEVDGKSYRLPTEAEWEDACRAGTTTPFSFGKTISTDQVNCDGNYPYGKGKKGVYRQKTTLVGSFPANAWGLFDMHGNVWEWCSDWYGTLGSENQTDPQGQSNGNGRVLRGGSFNYNASLVRSADRDFNEPAYRFSDFGFRLARTFIS